MLVFFRSPQPAHSWVTAAGTVLDVAAIMNAAVDIDHQPQADLAIRAGYVALRRICDHFGIPYDPDPSPTDPVSITRREFDSALIELEARGVPLKPDRDQAWRDYAGWRVNYDAALLGIAESILAPYAPRVCDRSRAAEKAQPVSLRRRRRKTSRFK